VLSASSVVVHRIDVPQFSSIAIHFRPGNANKEKERGRG
jgi:hypothetical protein